VSSEGQSSLTPSPDPSHRLRAFTPARVALGRAGGSLPTRALLDFQLAHALARDAVHEPFDAQVVAKAIGALGQEVTPLRSSAGERQAYLLRPDLGRTLDEQSRRTLAQQPFGECDVSIIVSDGLSALAAHRQAPALLEELLPRLREARLAIAPIAVVPFARVALQDEIGMAMKARVALILLGERPGLGSPDSLGAYLVFDPRPGRTDAERNCVSNIRPAGLPPAQAADLLHYLITQSLRRRISGVALKDDRAVQRRLG